MRVLLGVSGSIAAFKAATLVGELQARGHRVRAVLTPGATHFVAPLTFEALTGHSAPVEVWEGADTPGTVTHVALAEWAEVLVVAPASATTIARLALGMANEMLGAVALAYPGPSIVAPAMESGMYLHAATQAHLDTLRSRGTIVVGPASGRLASGASGIGRMSDVSEIADEVHRLEQDRDLSGNTILITAGPTLEPIDSVRFIGNRSSGKMGYAIARAAVSRGATVMLVTGPTAIPPPIGAEVVRVETSEEMLDAVMSRIQDADAAIMAAAVADFRPAEPHTGKLARSEGTSLHLLPTTDIAAAASAAAPRAVHVGFALEATDLEAHALEKLRRKGLDLIVANAISRDHNPFGSDRNTVALIDEAGVEHLPEMSKERVAQRILDTVVARLKERGTA